MPLYKYLHPDRIDVLHGQSIRFSSPAIFNDPFELKPHLAALATPEYREAHLIQILPEVLREEFEKLPIEFQEQSSFKALLDSLLNQLPEARQKIQNFEEHLIPKMQEIMDRKLEEMIGILCLSESAENLLMWAHYADSHRGFVIEFDEHSPFFDCRLNPEDEFRHLRKVSYSFTRPSLILSDVVDFTPFMTKGIDWRYEAEWRMIMPLDTASSVIGEGPHAVHLFEFPAKAIATVVLGYRMAEEKKENFRKLLCNSPKFSHVRCVDAKIDSVNYSVHVLNSKT